MAIPDQDPLKWTELELKVRERFDKQAIETQKQATEYGKLIITNLAIINAGGLVSLPAVSAFIEKQLQSISFHDVVLSSFSFASGLICALLSALAAYFNFGQITMHHFHEAEVAVSALRAVSPWGNEEYKKRNQELVIENQRASEKLHKSHGKSFVLSHIMGWLSIACFVIGSTNMVSPGSYYAFLQYAKSLIWH